MGQLESLRDMDGRDIEAMRQGRKGMGGYEVGTEDGRDGRLQSEITLYDSS